MNRAFQMFLAVSLMTACAACIERKSGPMERAGERGDEIIDNVKKGKAPLHKSGPLEKAGDAVDEALGTNERN